MQHDAVRQVLATGDLRQHILSYLETDPAVLQAGVVCRLWATELRDACLAVRPLRFVLDVLLVGPVVVMEARQQAREAARQGDPSQFECSGCSGPPTADEVAWGGCLSCGAALVPRGLTESMQLLALRHRHGWYDGDDGAEYDFSGA